MTSLRDRVAAEVTEVRRQMRLDAVKLLEFLAHLVEAIDAGEQISVDPRGLGADAAKLVETFGRYLVLATLVPKNMLGSAATPAPVRDREHERQLWASWALAERAIGQTAFDGKRHTAGLADAGAMAIRNSLRNAVPGFDAILEAAKARVIDYLDPLDDGGAPRLISPPTPVEPAAPPLLVPTPIDAGYLVDLLLLATTPLDPDDASRMSAEEEARALDEVLVLWRLEIERWTLDERKAVETWAVAEAHRRSDHAIEVPPCPPCARRLPCRPGERAPGVGDIVERQIGSSKFEGTVDEVPVPCRIVVSVKAVTNPSNRTKLPDQHAAKWRVVYRCGSPPPPCRHPADPPCGCPTLADL